MSYTLGLDIGSKSIGWAILRDTPKRSIVDIGVRVFPEGVDRDTKGAEKSKSATRREARGARRTHTRRNLRRDTLVKTLRENSLLPERDEDLRKLLSERDPYQIRARGLDEKLELHEFGRALFHINQRRGFKSNRKSGKAKDEDEGKVAKEAGELQQHIKEAGCRTLGEYFAGLNPEQQRIRDQYTFRSMYEEELDKLWKKQSEYYLEVLTDKLKEKVRDEVIFYQRPLKPTDELIGMCDLEPNEKRCPRGDWYARRFRILQDLNNLIIHNPDGSEVNLLQEQRQILLQYLGQKKEIKFDRIRKILGLMETQEFNLEQGGKVKSLKGDVFNWSMMSRNVFGAKVWDSMDDQEKIELNDACLELDDDELIEKMISKYGFTEEQADRVLKIPLPQRYMSFSRKAIIKLMPFMDTGALTSEAIENAGYTKVKQSKHSLDKLPLPEDLRNPIVNKALHEVRKVVNAVISAHGKPGRIVLEMARDVKGSKREREEIQFKIRQNEKWNDEARTRLIQDMKIRNPSRDDIIKYKLWEECGNTCPY
ncbi:MAG TPA: type II CRISPR RNA-guided endonuclease Cas9, partial [Desulfatiglandales bacterium]|nr:type II CRISPR RNA-guided endonuclease Cas9 [Desulfatiglandales bacterium]